MLIALKTKYNNRAIFVCYFFNSFFLQLSLKTIDKKLMLPRSLVLEMFEKKMT